MIDKVYSARPVQRQDDVSKGTETIAPQKLPCANNCSMDGLKALASYNQSFLGQNRPYFYDLSLKEHLQYLENKGYQEGKDYTIDEGYENRVFLNLKNDRGKEKYRIEYQDDKLLRWDDSNYEASGVITRTSYENAKIQDRTKIYPRSLKSQECFTKEGITFDTMPETLINYLKGNNITCKMKMQGDEDNNRSIYVEKISPDGSTIKSYVWYYGRNRFNEHAQVVSVCEFDENGNEVRRTSFRDDCTDVTKYFYKR